MRRVPALAGSPEGLARYVADHPDALLVAGAEAWSAFRNEAGSAYDELILALVAAQGGLCAYCEQRLTGSDGGLVHQDYQVEHLRAKSGPAGRALDWRNLLACCAGGTYRYARDETRYHPPKGRNISCGQFKDDDDLPGEFDPRQTDSSARWTTIGVDGRLSADLEGCRAAGLSAQRVEEVIAALNLNCERLRLAREKARAELVEWVVPVSQMLLQAAHLTPEQVDLQADLVVAGRLQPDQHGHLRAFWTTEREIVEPLSPGWIEDNRALLGW
jgi:uncharacterized protein (TIGR02646 family)